jgi:hypothetical protein
MASYTLLADSKIEPSAKAGATVYDCAGHDYGCANDDTRFTGIEHKSVTLNADGDYPFFTVPVRDLQRVEQAA